MTAVAPAGVIITIEESGSDVVATLTGAINDFTGATLVSTQNDNFGASLRPNESKATFGPGGSKSYTIYGIASVPADFGTFGSNLTATSSTGTSQFLIRNNPSSTLFLEAGYTAGTALSGTATYANQSFTSLGITPGTYAYTWTGDSITINVVPEPSTYAMALAGLACGGFLVKRRRKRA